MIRVLLADDHEVMREGLKLLLARDPGVTVVGEARDGESAVAVALKCRPDVVLMDVSMPAVDGIAATRAMIEALPNVKVIGLSMHADQTHVTQMLRAGAVAYILKEGAFLEVSTAIHTVCAGQHYLSPTLASVVVGALRNPGTSSDSTHSLTPREREILRCIALGMNTKSIALSLGLSGKTVDGHRRNLMEKLGLHSVAELTRLAVRQGLVSSAD
jgi:DNA-binding NarL/FixJ family response regulator